MIRRPPRSTLLSLHDALPISFEDCKTLLKRKPACGVPVDVDRSFPLNLRGIRTGQPGHIRQEALSLGITGRSEEHTSELQPRQYLVCRLLLEKKIVQCSYIF